MLNSSAPGTGQTRFARSNRPIYTYRYPAIHGEKLAMKKKLLFAYLTLALLLAGCVTIQVPEEFKGSGVFEVVLVQPTGQTPAAAAQAASPTPAPTETPLPSPTPLLPTATPLPTQPPTASPTAAPLTLLVDVMINANCRTGPGVSYTVLRYLTQGIVVEVLGRNPTGSWWLVRETADEQPCWVTMRALAYTFEMAGLPVITPAAPAGGPVAQQDEGDERSRPGDTSGGAARPTSAPPPTKEPTEPPPTEAPTEEPYPPPPNDPPDPYP